MSSCSVVSSLDAVVILSPVFVVNVTLFTRLLVGDGSSVPGLSLGVSEDVRACLRACLRFLLLWYHLVLSCLVLVVLVFLCAMLVM